MATHTESDPDSVRRVTYLFPVFLGLRLLPMGLWFLALPMHWLGGSASGGHLLLLALVVLATWAIHRWYRRRYGTVEPERLRFGRNWALLLGVVAAYAALRLGPRLFDLEPGAVVAILVLLLFATAVLFALPRALAGGRGLAGLFLIAAVVGGGLLAWTTRDHAAVGSPGTLFSLATGALLVLAGLVEHFQLERALGRSPDAP